MPCLSFQQVGVKSAEQSRSGLDWRADDEIRELGQKDKRGERKISDLFASSYPHSPFPCSPLCRVARWWWSVAFIFSSLAGGATSLAPALHPLTLYPCRETTETVCCNVSSDNFS